MLTLRGGGPLLNTGLAIVLLLTSACSSKSDPGAGADSDMASDEVSCTDDGRVDDYAAGLTKDGKLGALSFQLVESDPAPPAKGNNTFTVQVLDADGVAADVELGVDLTMPDHGHGTSVVPKLDYDADLRTFTVAPLYLFMAGVWRLDFTAYVAGTDQQTPIDSASFFFCIEG